MKSLLMVAGAIVMVGASALAASAPAPAPSTAAPSSAPMEMKPVNQMSDVKWGPGPDALPPGGQLAVMSGDPGAKGFVSLRAKIPAGYTVPPHWHPTDEHVTVLSGVMQFGDGDAIDRKTARTVKAGGYFVAAANMHHYAIAKSAAILQIDLMGPFEITYINPADDPRNKKPK